MTTRLERHASVIAALVVVGITAIGFVVRWRYLNSFETPVGIDGFYYAVQLRSLLSGEGLYYPASPMAFWLMLPGAWLLDPVAGAKLGAALGTVAAAGPVYAIVRRATGDRAAGILGAALIVSSAGSFYLATEFVKQGIGLTLALTFVATLGAALDATDARARRNLFIVAAALFVATLLTHLTSLGIALIFAVPPLWTHLARGARTNRLLAIGKMAGALLLVVLLAMLLVPAARKALAFGGIIGPATFEYLDGRNFRQEVALGAAAAFATLLLARGTALHALLIGPVALALFLALPWLSPKDPDQVVYRLRIMAFVPLAICAPAALSRLIARARASYRWALPLAGAVGVLALVPLTYTEPVAEVNPSLLKPVGAIAEHTPSDAVIIVRDNALAFMVKWLTNREARMKRIPSDSRPTYRLVTPGVIPAIQLERFTRELPPQLSAPVRLSQKGPPIWLLAEPTWAALVETFPPLQRGQLDAMGRTEPAGRRRPAN